MADYHEIYKSWSIRRLEIERARLSGEFTQIKRLVANEKDDLKNAKNDVNKGWWSTGAGVTLAIGGFVVGATTPLGLAVLFGGAGLTYWSGKTNFEASARCNEKASVLEALKGELEEIEARVTAIDDLLRR